MNVNVYHYYCQMINERTPDVLRTWRRNAFFSIYSTLQITTRAEDHGLDRPISPTHIWWHIMIHVSQLVFFFVFSWNCWVVGDFLDVNIFTNSTLFCISTTQNYIIHHTIHHTQLWRHRHSHTIGNRTDQETTTSSIRGRITRLPYCWLRYRRCWYIAWIDEWNDTSCTGTCRWWQGSCGSLRRSAYVSYLLHVVLSLVLLTDECIQCMYLVVVPTTRNSFISIHLMFVYIHIIFTATNGNQYSTTP